MKAFLTPTGVTFVPGAAGVGTVAASGIDNFDVKRLVAVINQTRGVVIYATGSPLLKYTGTVPNGIVLGVDTTGHNAADTIQWIYEDPTPLPVAQTVPTAGNVVGGFQNMTTANTRVRLTGNNLPPAKTRVRLSFFIDGANVVDTTTFWLTGISGTVGNGIPLFQGILYTFERDAGDYYIISNEANQKVYILEQY